MTVKDALTDPHIVDTIERVGTNTVYGASVVSIFSGLTVNEWGVVVGMFLGVSTFIFNVWFKMKYQRGNNESQD